MSTTLTTTTVAGGRGRARILVILLAGIVVVTASAIWSLGSQAANKRPTIPTSTVVENASGIRVLRATLVADGGLVDVRYLVLDRGKAGKYTGDLASPPVLDNDRNGKQLDTVLAMQHRKDLRNGGTYFLIYHNTDLSVRRGDRIDLTIAGVTLNNVPVE